MKSIPNTCILALYRLAESRPPPQPTPWRLRTPLQRAIQLLKRHRDVVFEADPDNSPASIIVTTLAAHSYEQERELFTALLNMVQRMPTKVENSNGRWWIENPAHSGENFADKWNETPKRRETFLAWLARLEQDLLRASRLPDESEARTTIAKAFGVGTRLPGRAGASVPALGSESHVLPAPWPQRPTYRCSVRGRVYLKTHGRKALWSLANRPVPKHFGLRFEANTDTPAPFEVKWQVANTGQEAVAANALRGGFEEGQGHPNSVRWESTLYAGTHWIEAFVIKDGICVAKSGRMMIRIRP